VLARLRTFYFSLDERERFWFGLLVLGLVVRAWQIFVCQHPLDGLFSDPGRHWENAKNFLAPFPTGGADPFFYQFWLHFLQVLTAENRTALGLVMLLHSWAYPATWYLFAKEVFKTRLAILRFTSLVSILPTFSFMFMYFMTETFLLPLLGACLWSTWRARRLGTNKAFLLSVTLWLIAILTRVVVLPLAGLCIVVAWWSVRTKVKSTLISLILVASGLTISAVHGYAHFHTYKPFGQGVLNTIYFMSNKLGWKMHLKHGYYYEFASPSFFIKPFEPFSDWQSKRTGYFELHVDREKEGADLKQVLKEQFEKNKDKLPLMIRDNLIFLLFGHAWPEAHKNRLDGYLALWERWIWFPIIMLSLIASTYFLTRGPDRLFAGCVCLFTVAMLSAHVAVIEGRYRKPLEPLALMMVVYSVERLSEKKTRRKRRANRN